MTESSDNGNVKAQSYSSAALPSAWKKEGAQPIQEEDGRTRQQLAANPALNSATEDTGSNFTTKGRSELGTKCSFDSASRKQMAEPTPKGATNVAGRLDETAGYGKDAETCERNKMGNGGHQMKTPGHRLGIVVRLAGEPDRERTICWLKDLIVRARAKVATKNKAA